MRNEFKKLLDAKLRLLDFALEVSQPKTRQKVSTILTIHKMPGMGTGAKCGTCNNILHTVDEIEFIIDNGECLSCDHVRGDQ